MQTFLRKLIIIAILSCLIGVQPAQAIAKTSKEPISDVAITAINYSTEVTAAHITAPTTFPIQTERNADSTFLKVNELIFKDRTYVSPDPPRKMTFESAGFIYVRYHQSNYLPLFL